MSEPLASAEREPPGWLPIDPDLDAAEDTPRHLSAGPFDTTGRSRWPRLRPSVLAAVFVGGCVGGLARYAITQAWPTPAYRFPWSTFLVNDVGAFILALLIVVVADVLPRTAYLRPLVGTGFCGALTTFSSVVASADELVAHGHARTGAMYVVASVLAGLASAALGLVVGRSVAANRNKARQRGAQ